MTVLQAGQPAVCRIGYPSFTCASIGAHLRAGERGKQGQALQRRRELRPTAFREERSEGHGGLHETLIVRGDCGHPAPDQTEPGSRSNCGGLDIGLLRLNRLLVGGPGPMPVPPGCQQASRFHVSNEHGGPSGKHEDESAGESAEDRTPAGVHAGRRPARMGAETVQGDQQQSEQDGGADDGGQRRCRTAVAASQATVTQTAAAASAGGTDPSPPSRPLSSMRTSMANPALNTRRRSRPTPKWTRWRRRGSSRCLSSS